MVLRRTLKWQSVLASAFAAMVLGPVAAQTPSPAVLVTVQSKNPRDNALLIVDPKARKVVGRVALSGSPHNIAVSPDGRFAYTSNALRGTDKKNFPGVSQSAAGSQPLPSDTISVVDLEAGKEVRVVDVGVGANPHGIYFAAGKVYFTVEGNKAVGRYDPQHNRVDWTGGVGQNRVHELVVTRDGSRIFTANIGSDTVALIAPWDPNFDALTVGSNNPPWNLTLIPAGRGTEGIALTPDEKELWVSNRASNDASVIDVATRKVVHTVDLENEDPIRITITPDGKWALAPGDSGEVVVVDVKARKVVRRIANVGTQIHGIVVSPDSSLGYAAAQDQAEIVILDLKSFSVAGRISTGTPKTGSHKPSEEIDGLAWAQRP